MKPQTKDTKPPESTQTQKSQELHLNMHYPQPPQ